MEIWGERVFQTLRECWAVITVLDKKEQKQTNKNVGMSKIQISLLPQQQTAVNSQRVLTNSALSWYQAMACHFLMWPVIVTDQEALPLTSSCTTAALPPKNKVQDCSR